MAKKVLNKTHRETLENLANRLVHETADKSAVDAAYNACADMVSKLVKAKYPEADMAVLQKYDVGRKDSCIYLSAGYGGMERFSFRSSDERIPHVPDRYCNNRTPYLLTDEQVALYDAFKKADVEFQQAIRSRLADYRALIANARTFEELVEIWPAADQLREKICGTSRAVSVMSDDVLARIKADAANSVAQEA